MSGPFWSERKDHVLVTLRLTPNARQERIDGPQTLADGKTVLAARVRAVPADGEANAAACALLAKACGLPKSRVSLVGGQTQRVKVLRLDGDPAELVGRLGKFDGT